VQLLPTLSVLLYIITLYVLSLYCYQLQQSVISAH